MKFMVLVLTFISFLSTSFAASNELKDLKLVQNNEKLNEVRSLKAELLIEKSEKKAIKQAQLLLKKYKNTAMEAGLIFRLAELHVRRAKAAHFFEIHRKSKTLVNLAPHKLKTASSKRHIKRAISLYERLQKKFPKFEKMDLVYFNNAFARQGIRDTKAAEYLYWLVIKNHPNSYLVPDAHLAIGEISFQRRKYKYALTHFKAIKKYPTSRAYSYGLYKSAWSYYNLSMHKKGIDELVSVISYSKAAKERGQRSGINLLNEALQDIPLFYEDHYPSENAYDFLSGIIDDSKQLNKSLFILSELYDRHSRFKDVNIIYNQILDNEPSKMETNTIYDNMVWNFERMKKRDLAISQLNKFQKICNAIAPVEKHKKDCHTKLRVTSIKLAKKWLRLWNKNKHHAPFADSSEKAFKVYLAQKDKGEDAYKARYAYAELLFKRKKYNLASSQYLQVSENTTQSNLSHDSLYASIVSLEKHANNKWKGQERKDFQVLSQKYLAKFPKGKYYLDLQFKTAHIAYENADYKTAAPLLKKLGDRHKNTAKGIQSQDLYLDILNHQKDYVSLKKYAQNLLRYKNTQKRRVALEKIFQESYFLEVQNLEKDKKYSAAIKGYSRFIKKSKDSKLNKKAQHNIISLFHKTGQLQSAAAHLVSYAKKYSGTKESKDSLIKAANIYENLAQPKKSADVLLLLAKKEPSSKSKWKALAADYYQIDGTYTRSKAIYKELLNSPGNKHAAHSLKQLLKIEKKYGTQATYERLLRHPAINKDAQLSASSKLHFLKKVYAQKKYPEAFAGAKRILNMGAMAGTHNRAQARLIQAKILSGELKRQSVRTSVSRLSLVLGMKTEKLEKAQRAFQSTIKFKDIESSAEAMLGLAESYLDYSKSLLNMPAPKGLPAKDLPALKAEIERLALPMEEKGIETLLEAHALTQKADIPKKITQQIKNSLKRNKQAFPEDQQKHLSLPRLEVPVFSNQHVGGL